MCACRMKKQKDSAGNSLWKKWKTGSWKDGERVKKREERADLNFPSLADKE